MKHVKAILRVLVPCCDAVGLARLAGLLQAVTMLFIFGGEASQELAQLCWVSVEIGAPKVWFSVSFPIEPR